MISITFIRETSKPPYKFIRSNCVRIIFALAFTISAILTMSSPQSAKAAHECLAYYDISLNIVIDYSGSMNGWKHELAKAFALQVIDELQSRGRLQRAGGIGFPDDVRPPGFNLPVTPEYREDLRDYIQVAMDPIADGTPLYGAMIEASALNAALGGTGRNILVVITDGEDNQGLFRPDQVEFALQTNNSWNYLVFVGNSTTERDALREPGARILSDMVSNIAPFSHSNFLLAIRGTSASELANEVLQAACINHAPHANLNIMPNPLQLGVGGEFRVFFDASSSTDVETTDISQLDYNWTILRPDGTVHYTERGINLRIIAATFNDDYLPATEWEVTLEVTDPSGGSNSTTRTFQVLGSPPVIEFQGGGVINALEHLSVRTNQTTDIDGGYLEFAWRLVSAPESGTFARGHRFGNTQGVGWLTTENDITILSDDTRIADEYRFHLTVQDDEGEETPGEIAVDVRNLPPQAEITGTTSEVDVGETLNLHSIHNSDRDGGVIMTDWDVIQAPAFLTGLPAYDWNSTSDLTRNTERADAGTWIFRLTLTDNEGESESAEVTVLVDAKPEASIEGPERIGSITETLSLIDRSVDPDSACLDDPESCHTNLEGPVVGLSPDFVRRTWTLIDVPIEWIGEYPLGPVEEVFGVPNNVTELNLDPGTLRAGYWTFQLEVEDGEGNTAVSYHQVEVVDEAGHPIAIVSPPQRYVLDLLGRASSPIVVTGESSFDYDNVLAGDPLAPGMGIDTYQWEVLTQPTGCSLSGPSTTSFMLFPAGVPIPVACHGYFELVLTVNDDDSPQQQGIATTTVFISNCPGSLCIDYPTTAIPQIVEFVEDTDILIYYHLNSALYSDPAFRFGLIARLEIFHENDPANPVFTSFDSNIATSSAGSILVFHWNGYWGAERPHPGRYTVKISLLDYSLAPTAYETIETNAIELAVDNLSIQDESDRFVNVDDLNSGSNQFYVSYAIDGSIPPDRIEWRLIDEMGTPIMTQEVRPDLSGAIYWDGGLGSSRQIDVGVYTFEIEAFREGASLTGIVRRQVTFYELRIESDIDGTSIFPVLVNNDDDNLNGIIDGTETGAIAAENDLLEVRVVFVPEIEGRLEVLSMDMPPRLNLYDRIDRTGGPLTIPLTFTLPEDTMPSALYIEGVADGTANLNLRFTPNGHPSLPDRNYPIRVAGIYVENNTHSLQQYLNIARWDNAYGSMPDFPVQTMPGNDFIDQDPSNFYIKVIDPAANANASATDNIELSVSTVDDTNTVDDDPTTVILGETGTTGTAINTGQFTSVSQMLVTHDFQDEGETCSAGDNSCSDDNFPAYDGFSGSVRDDTTGDRTHRAMIDGAINLSYEPIFGGPRLDYTIPVCQRSPEMRRIVYLDVTIFDEPYWDTLIVNNSYDPGELFIDISNGNRFPDTTGTWGGVASYDYVRSEIEKADIAWSPACIKFELGRERTVPAPTVGPMAVNILVEGDGFNWPSDRDTVVATYGATGDIDRVEVFVVGTIVDVGSSDTLGVTNGPYDNLPGLGMNTMIFIRSGLLSKYRVLAHELGHALTNSSDIDVMTVTPIFFPAQPSSTALLYEPDDTDINQYRRFPEATMIEARTDRSQRHAIPGDPSSPAPASNEPGNYLLHLP